MWASSAVVVWTVVHNDLMSLSMLLAALTSDQPTAGHLHQTQFHPAGDYANVASLMTANQVINEVEWVGQIWWLSYRRPCLAGQMREDSCGLAVLCSYEYVMVTSQSSPAVPAGLQCYTIYSGVTIVMSPVSLHWHTSHSDVIVGWHPISQWSMSLKTWRWPLPSQRLGVWLGWAPHRSAQLARL